jgi:hypothetical protein
MEAVLCGVPLVMPEPSIVALVGAASTPLEDAALPPTVLLELDGALREPVAFWAAAPPKVPGREVAAGGVAEVVLLSCCHTEPLKEPWNFPTMPT